MKICLGTIFLLLISMMSLFALNKHSSPLLVLDMAESDELPRKFRMTTDPILDASINRNGLAELKAAASAQFSKGALQAVIRRLRTSHITVVDLRQESHGFLNGNAISWYGFHDAANENKTPATIEMRQRKLLAHIREQKTIRLDKILEKNDGIIKRTAPLSYPVNEVDNEHAIVKHQHIKYERLYVQDFHGPLNSQVDRFIEIVKALPKDEWLYVHCRGGSGRSTTFMVMLDIMHHAKTVSLEDILKRQAALGGKDLRFLPDQHSYKYSFAKKRLAFIKKFYNYAKTNKNHFKTTWSHWLHLNT